MEGILAVLGFWTFIILLVVRKPITRLIEKQSVQAQNAELQALNHRVAELEMSLSNMTRDMIELRETTDFTHKLLTTARKEPAKTR